MPDKIEVFIVFAQEDIGLLRELENHLRPLELEELIAVWHEGKMIGGMDREQEIKKHWKTSSIILLLISANFMASDTCYSLAKQAVEKNKQPQVCATPVLLQEVDWEYSIFGKLVPLPSNARPIASWTNRNAAYLDVVRGIRKIVADLKGASAGSTTSSPVSAGSSPDKETPMPQDIENKPFDVFLCHNNKDKPEVKEIGEELKKRGLKPWLDEWEIRPGTSWQRVLEEQIEKINAVAVFVGKDAIGPWQNMELDAYIRKFVKLGCPVVPVLLKDAPTKPKLPIFLQEMHYVDFRKSEPDPMEQLIWGITGNNPYAFHPAAEAQGGDRGASVLPAPLDMPTAKISIRSLSFPQKSELTEKLLACRTMRNRQGRNRVVQELSFGTAIPREDVDTDDVMNIVNACLDYEGGLQQLLDIVAFFEKNSLPMRELRAFVQSLA